MKRLLLLGGLRYLLPVIDAAHKLGCYVITCDYLPDNIAHKYSDEYHNVSILDKEAVLVLAKKLNIDGIMAFAGSCDRRLRGRTNGASFSWFLPFYFNLAK